MKKVVILGVADIRHMTMISMYTDYFEKNNISYEIICSERYQDEKIAYGDSKIYKYPMMGNTSAKIVKLFNFIGFHRYAVKILKKNKYDFVVVWGENTAVLFADFLKKYGDYCVNIRDSVFSGLPFYFKKLTKAVKNSAFSTWCAQLGLDLLPKHNYVIVLNQNKKLLKEAVKKNCLCSKDEPLHVGVLGSIRHIEESKQIIDALANDKRYIVQFFGNGSEDLEDYAKRNQIENVECKGKFYPEETAKLLDKIDVMNVYCGDGRNDVNITLGSPIRFGYATHLYKPSIVSPNTRLSDKTKELGIGYTVEKFDDLADDLYKWYHNLNFEKFVQGCDCYNREFEETLMDFYKACDKYIVKN